MRSRGSLIDAFCGIGTLIDQGHDGNSSLHDLHKESLGSYDTISTQAVQKLTKSTLP